MDAHARFASALSVATSPGVYSEHTCSFTVCGLSIATMASMELDSLSHSSKYSSGITYPFGRTKVVDLSSRPNLTALPPSSVRSTATTLPIFLPSRCEAPALFSAAISAARAALVCSYIARRLHLPPPVFSSTSRSVALIAPSARARSSPVASLALSRHIFFPARIAAPISSALAENSSQTSFAFSNASNASSAAFAASVIATCEALYAACRPYTPPHTRASRRWHSDASEWSYS